MCETGGMSTSSYAGWATADEAGGEGAVGECSTAAAVRISNEAARGAGWLGGIAAAGGEVEEA